MDTPQKLVPLIRAHPVFGSLSEESISGLIGQGRELAIAAGETLVHQGDASDCAFILLEGEAEIFVETSFGPVMLAPVTKGQLFGELGALAGIPRTATVRARSDVRVLRIDAGPILALGRTHPEILLAVIKQLGQRTVTVNRAIGFYTQALAALEKPDFDPAILDQLLNPVPELLNFAQTFRRMAEQIKQQRTRRQEMASAIAIQRAMLPEPLERSVLAGRADLFAMIRPAREVGGDLYNFFVMDKDRLALVIGDVSGKGVPASLFMAITQTLMRLTLQEIPDLATAVGRANDLLSADNKETMFATLFCGVLDLRSGEFVYCNCGHNPPLLLRSSGAQETLPSTGPALAVMASIPYETGKASLRPGDRLFLYTDGITEATDAAEQLFGDARLEAACRELPSGAAQELVEGVVRRVDAFVADAPQFDDITCLALCYRGPAGPGPKGV
jgi:serine phosphatase RsbU (regulator of sigma subunit)